MTVGDASAGIEKVLVGPAGWDYPDWHGVVYPKKEPRGFDELGYLAHYFDTVEVNSTFYRPADPRAAERWVKRIEHNPRFQFTAKLWKRFTHERTSAWTAEEAQAARAAMDVLAAAGRLGAVLLQFPWSFKRDEPSQEWLRDLLRGFADLPLVVEVRHTSWNDADVLSELGARGVGLVNVDQPLFAKSIKPAALATSAVAYVRLHGRNYQDWFREKAGRDQRYDYLYTPEELRPWVDRIRDIAARPAVRTVFAVTNNHVVGKAPANGAMIESMLSGKKTRVPRLLYARYQRELEPFAFPEDVIGVGESGTLPGLDTPNLP
jgi:uncharacterized protein YecE (DUF72 family)